MVFVDIKQFKNLTDAGRTKAFLKWDEHQQAVYFSKVRVGYGYKNFFICPCCGEYKTKLYLDKNNIFKCVKCCSIKPYNGIQNTTKGGYEYISYKMERFAEKSGIGRFEYPFDYEQHPKPKNKHRDKWERNLAIMQALENMRSQSIFFDRIWNSKTIQKVEQGKNKCLSYPLLFLKNYFIDIK